MSSRGLAALLRDRYLIAFGIGLLVLTALYSVAAADGWLRTGFLTTLSDLPFLLILVVAFVGRARVSTGRARSFWILAACAQIAWIGPRVLQLLLSNEALATQEAGVAEDLFFSTFYLFTALALEQVPHVTGSANHPSAQRLRAACVVVFAIGMVAYFAAVPTTLGSAHYGTWVPSMLMYISLDACVLVRAARLRSASRGTPWSTVYGLFALVALLWLLTDTYEALEYAGILAPTPPGSAVELFWFPSLGLTLAAARIPNWTQRGPVASIVPTGAGTPTPRWAAAIPLSLAIFFLSLHVGLHTTGLLDQDLRTPRDICAFSVVSMLLGLTTLYQRRLEIESSELRERQRLLDHEVQLAQRMEAVGRLAGGVAHDFNNSLQLIGLHAELLSTSSQSGSTAASAGAIRSAVEQAKGLTDQLLTLSGERRFEPRAMDLGRVVETIGRIARRAVGQDVALIANTSGPARIIWADPIQLEHAILNLILNARDALGGSGSIELIVSTRDESSANPTHVLRVRDTGDGMDEQTQRRIFEPFFTTKAGAGHGLGLSVVYGIAEECGAEIRLQSAPGDGSTFDLLFPAHDEEPDAQEEPPAELPQPSGQTILIVEDEAPILLVLSQHLRAQGYEVLSCDNGEDALRIASDPETRIDMLLSDVVMPNLSGPRLAERLLEIRPELPVAFMSGHAREEFNSLSGSLSEAPMLDKPFRAEELDELLITCLGSSALPVDTKPGRDVRATG